MKGFPDRFWGKLGKSPDGQIQSWHPLGDHCADVAACVEALLSQTLLGKRLAAASGIDVLSPQQTQRLSVLAALHDVGKFSVGFYKKAFGRKDSCGHLAELLGLFSDPRFSKQITEALLFTEMRNWADDFDGLFIATVSHHGLPVPLNKQIEPKWWEPTATLDPFRDIASLLQRTRVWFPDAWKPAGDKLPSSSRFQHAWNGLLTLADWIASDQRFFRFTEISDPERMLTSRSHAKSLLIKIGVDSSRSRESLGEKPVQFDRIAPRPDMVPRRIQVALMDLPPSPGGSVTLIEAETGSGKTEAALVHFVRLFQAGLVDGMYFALPTRTAATQIYHRIADACKRLFPESQALPVILAVPGYVRVDEQSGKILPNFDVLWNDNDAERMRFRGWAAEHPKRYLSGAICVGTIDQVLLSALLVSHADLRSTSLLRQLLVVDEVHASDGYMNRVLEEVLRQHVAAKGHVLLMSATLGSTTRARLLGDPNRFQAGTRVDFDASLSAPYPLVSIRKAGVGLEEIAVQTDGTHKNVTIVLSPLTSPQVADRALSAASLGARVLVVRNTVTTCLETQREVEGKSVDRMTNGLLFKCSGVPTPHHSRYARIDRIALDGAIEIAYGPNRSSSGLVTVATQTVEQSLDIDCDLLITDICPMDVLLQRIGRLHRHQRVRPSEFHEAHVVVVIPDTDLVDLIRANGEARGPNGLGTVYEDLRVIEATLQTLRNSSMLSIPADNRRLVEAATHPAALEDLCRRQGGSWLTHHEYILGELLGEGRLGGLNTIRRDIAFGEDGYLFPSGDLSRRIQSRLGEGDRIVRFKVPQESPFTTEPQVTELTIPFHLVARGTSAETEYAENVTRRNGGFSFMFGTRSYEYDRLGLQLCPSEAGANHA